MGSPRLLPAVIAGALALVALVPGIYSVPQHGDESMYLWKAAYYTDRLVRLDFSPGTDPLVDPGWGAFSPWALEQPFGSHVVYAVAMRLTQTPPPSLPYIFWNQAHTGPDTAIPSSTLPFVRRAAVLCATVGLALIGLRLGWPAVCASAIFLLIPHVRVDLVRAWAEGPLLLGLGLCIVAYGSRWFTVTAGLAAALKLTALAIWPLVWLRPPLRVQRFPHLANVGISALVVAILTPYSWGGGGPLYVGFLLFSRLREYASQCAVTDGPYDHVFAAERYGAVFLPSRYIWPIELAVLLVVCTLVPRILRRSGGHAPRQEVR